MERAILSCCAMVVIVTGCSPSGGGTAPAAAGGAKTPTPPASQAASVDTTTPAAPTGAASATPVPSGPPTMTFTLAANGLPEKGMWKCDPVFQDVNGDGHLDIAAIVRLGDGPHVWLGDGEGNWTDSSKGLKRRTDSCGGGIAFGDVNGDGNVDLCAADHCKGVYVYLGDGAGTWRMVTEELFPSEVMIEGRENMYQGAEDLDVGDVDGDGHLDIVAGASDEGGINVYFGDGTGSNWTRRSDGLPSKGWAPRVRFADLDADGDLDLIASSDEGPRVWHNDGTGAWEWASTGLPTPSIRGLYTGIAVADIDRDGRLDLAFANWVDGPEAYLQDENGYWTKTADVFPGMVGGAIGIALGPIDGDDNVDMVVAGRMSLDMGMTRGVYALRGDGRGGFEYVANSGLPSTGLLASPGAALGDIDGDGVLDVAACTGLLVETQSGPEGPVVPQRVIVWRTSLPAPAAASTTTDGRPGD